MESNARARVARAIVMGDPTITHAGRRSPLARRHAVESRAM
jgi:hypothetical protein